MAIPALEAIFHFHDQTFGRFFTYPGSFTSDETSSRSTQATNWFADMPDIIATPV